VLDRVLKASRNHSELLTTHVGNWPPSKSQHNWIIVGALHLIPQLHFHMLAKCYNCTKFNACSCCLRRSMLHCSYASIKVTREASCVTWHMYKYSFTLPCGTEHLGFLKSRDEV
jgi:hypothetical protein